MNGLLCGAVLPILRAMSVPLSTLQALRPAGHLDASSSAILAAFVLAAWWILVLVALALFVRYRRRAARAEAAFDPRAPLVPGEAVVRGAVERAIGEEVAVRVEVEQEGSESESSGSWSHRWTERDRRARVRPFYLRHATGRRIRVEPPERVRLVDDMDGCIRVSLTERIRIAELTPGEQVFAHGVLSPTVDPEPGPQAHGYRDALFGLVLRPLRGRMLLSSRPLGEPFRQRAGRHRLAGIALFVLAASATLAHGDYLLRRALGVGAQAAVVDRRTVVTTDDEGYETTDYRLILQPTRNEQPRFEADVERWSYDRLTVGDRVPIRAVPRWPALAQLGARDSVALVAPLIWIVVVSLVAIAYLVVSIRPIGWWEGSLEEGGGGRLTDS